MPFDVHDLAERGEQLEKGARAAFDGRGRGVERSLRARGQDAAVRRAEPRTPPIELRIDHAVIGHAHEHGRSDRTFAELRAER